MKQLQTLFILALLLLAGLNCGTTDNPVNQPEDIETPTGSLQGEVAPIEGIPVQVRLIKAGQLIAQTEIDSSYEFSGIEEGNYTIQLTAKGYETVEIDVTVVAEQTVPVDKVTLVALTAPVSHLRGVLTDAETEALLSEVRIQLTDEAGEKQETLTTKDGVFTFENLPINQTFTLTVKHTGYEDNEVNVKPIPADETFELDIELTPVPEQEELGPGEGLSIGSDAPGFKLPDANNKQHALADYIGKKNVVLVFFRGRF